MTLRPSNEAAAKMALADECHQLSAPSDNCVRVDPEDPPIRKEITVSLTRWPLLFLKWLRDG
jgi:hypothetical protein